jgi:apolipoprotein N-acyltransferase
VRAGPQPAPTPAASLLALLSVLLAVSVAVLAGAAHAASIAWPLAPRSLADLSPSFSLAFLPSLGTGEPSAWLQWLSMLALALLLARSGTAWQAVWRGWLFATAMLAATFWWLFISMHLYGGMAAPLAAAAVLALAAALALYYAAAAGLWWWLARRSGWGAWGQAALFAALWTLAEWARGTWFTGFPWGASGYAHLDSLPWLAPYSGVYGMGALSAGLAMGAVAWTRGGTMGRLGMTSVLVGWAVLLAVPGAPGWVGALLPEHTRPAGSTNVRLLQGNIAQDEKFEDRSGVPLALQWYAEQVQEAARESPADQGAGGRVLVVAPETAIPQLPQVLDADYWRSLLAANKGSNAAVLLGLPLGSWEAGYTNSVLGWRPGEGVPEAALYRYDKHHLVPFGEFIPWGFRWFTELMNIPLGDFARGALGQPSFEWDGQRFAPNICYEDLFGEELAVAFTDPAQAPTVLVNVSNIAWFGNTVAIDQHRHISRLRALELGRPMLRATNTGATAIISHRGEVVQELPRLTRGVLAGTVEGRQGTTPYARWAGRWGLWPMVGLCAALVLLAGLSALLWPARLRP